MIKVSWLVCTLKFIIGVSFIPSFMLLRHYFIGASLSEPHINVLNASGLCIYVCAYVFVRRTVNFVLVE